jgi:hypothetical protein
MELFALYIVMGFKEYFLAQEYKMRKVLDIKSNPIIPPPIPKTGFRPGGAAKMKVWQVAKPYKPLFRTSQSLLKKS